MKTKLIFTLLSFFALSFLRFTNTTYETLTNPPLTPPGNNEFLTGVMSSGDELGYNNMNALNLNLWHRYTEHDQGWTGINNDTPEEDPVNYFSAVKQRVIDNYNNGMFTYCDRPKFQRLVYGQRSDYQCENTHQNSDLWFYTYNTHTAGSDEPDGNAMVKHCSDIALGPNAGWVCKDVKANREQCNRFWNYEQRDSIYPWLVKPRIRIPANAPVNYPNKRVCRVDVLDWNGKFLDSVTIFAKSFAPWSNPTSYQGEYREDYYYYDLQNPGIDVDYRKIPQGYAFNPDRKWFAEWSDNSCKVDFRVWWYDEVEMWIDYVRVDNEKADKLFKGYYEGQDPNFPNRNWIRDEVEIAVNMQTAGSVRSFYVEEFEFNILPCMKYVNDKIKYWSAYWANYYGVADPHLSITVNLNYDLYRASNIPFWGEGQGHDISASWVKRTLVDYSGGYKDFIISDYPMLSYRSNHSFIPNTLPSCNTPGGCSFNEGSGILADSRSPQIYDQWLQDFLDNDNSSHTENGEFTKLMKIGSSVAKETNMPFVPMLQTHLWHTTGDYQLREPTNEELKMMATVAIAYGARGILWFWYSGYGDMLADKDYGRGITDVEWFREMFGGDLSNATFSPRHDNVYHQWTGTSGNDKSSKFNTVADLNYLFKNKWGPTLMSFNNSLTKSCIYRLEDERNIFLQESYFRDIVSYEWGSGVPPCEQDRPDTIDAPNPPDVRYECNESRYLQAATFKKVTDDGNRYFMIVNRRCSPIQSDHVDGARYMRVIFDQNSGEFATYNSWNIVDVENPRTIVGNFDKTAQVPYVDLGWFEPGQGRLYKIVPVLPSGGILAGDENLSDVSFTCEAPVYNNGHNITIGANTTIHFNDSSRFVMNGGVFTVGDQNTSGSQNITSDAVTGSTWLGHSFTNCEVNIYGATFTGLTNDTTYALNFIDCPVVDIRGCTFNSNSSLKGAINTICFSNPFLAINNVYIGGNTFNSSGSTIPTVNVSSYAGITTPLIIENNTFNEGNTAIFLNGVTGGAIKGNTITDNYIGINALTSSVDIAENTISSSINSSTGIFSAGGSEIRLCKAGNLAIGGYNSITNTGGSSNNISVTGAYFLMSEGKNVFDITSNQSSNHLNGYFPYFTAVSYNEQENCFKVDNTPVDPPINYVTDGYQGSQITFTFTPYLTGCEVSQCQDYIVVSLGGGVYDTICNGSSGSGGGHSGSQKRAFDLHFAKEKYDSLCVLIRYRNFTQAKSKCLELINTYPDSIQSLNAVSKLFLASFATDTSYNAANELKTFYENLILNHGNNVSLVKRVNYFILKCKVRMHEYSQAMAGFQQIINLNPYSYEGLIARWDYMATSLLIQGQGGGISSIDNDQLTIDNQFDESYEFDKYGDDKSPFSKEQRQDIRKSINTAIEISKNDDETKMKTLEVKSQLGDVNASKELLQMKSLKQVVKTEKPKSILEHVKIVSEDIRKVFGSNTSSKGNEPKNIPHVFRLSQNYPNPFNPTTKINYDLPRDSKVNIVIYDILGREVKRLLNNELKSAGSYIIDFKASNYASGVYFYRIEAEESNGNKFVDSKKMVLLK